MAKTVYNAHLDLAQNELQNAVLQNLATAPSNPKAGQSYFDTTLGVARTYDGAVWSQSSGVSPNMVTQSANSTNAGSLKVAGGTDRTVTDYAGGAGLIKSDANGVVAPAVAGTDFVTPNGTETLKNKTLDGSFNTFGNIPVLSILQSDIIKSNGNLSNADDWTLVSSLRFKNEIDAVRTYADGLIAGNDAMVLKGGIDCSANPNYPAADAGHTYKVTVAGKIGGASGVNVEVGDTVICTVDATASGDQATVGANWIVLQTNLDQATTTTVGTTRYATVSETSAKTVTNAAVTPASLTSFPKKYSTTIGDGTATSFAVTHNLNNTVPMVSVSDGTSKIECQIDFTSANVVTVQTNSVLTTGQYTVTVIG